MPGLTEEQITDLAAEPDRVRRGLKMLALVGELVGDVPIVVGGFAVETYTQGGYTTGDIDALTRRRDEVVAVLGESGFERRARHWIHPELARYPLWWMFRLFVVCGLAATTVALALHRSGLLFARFWTTFTASTDRLAWLLFGPALLRRRGLPEP